MSNQDHKNKKSIKLSLLETNPELVKQWHPTKNGLLEPKDVSFGCGKKIWWKCSLGDDHVWSARVADRAGAGDGCPFCDRKKVSQTNSLLTLYPQLAKEFHPVKNKPFTPAEVLGGGNKKYWWICSRSPDHEWLASVGKRANGRGCPICRGLKVVNSNCLATIHPQKAKEWHSTKNGSLTPFGITAGSDKKIWWLCSIDNDHEWQATCKDRTLSDSGCPYCSGAKASKSNCLATTHPEIAKELHPTKNGSLTPSDITAGSGRKIWWQCSVNKSHEWQAKPYNRLWGTNCPFCNCGWTAEKMSLFVHSLLPHLDGLTPVELYIIFQQQSGLLNATGKVKSLVQALKTGRFPKEELGKFDQGQPSLVDEFIANSENNSDETNKEDVISACILEKDIINTETELPIIETKDALASLESCITSNMDKEAIDYLICSACVKFWNHAFVDKKVAIEQLESHKDGIYSQEVKRRCLEQYYGVLNLNIPEGYSFYKNGKLCPPNLMQRFTAYMVQKTKRFGNWSGTGAGKTLSAILASRVIDAKLTIVCCPNSVVDGWEKAIKEIYPDSIVVTKDTRINIEKNHHYYVVLNYEFFQQCHAEGSLKKLLNNKIDFIVIDEIHHSKQRVAENMSKRRKVIAAMLTEASAANRNLHVLGMSATPVINNLFEGRTLIDLITGVYHDDLNVKPTINNCISLYQKFVLHGTRCVPRYNQTLSIKTVDIDCGYLLDELRKHKEICLGGSVVALEAILTKAKIPIILDYLKSKTIVYTYYVKDILIPLQEAVESAGWKTAVYSGDDKSGLESFLYGDADVLIATSCIGTGVDGLQMVCNRIIVNTLPWTHAEFEQLKGRIYRQGQVNSHVDIIVPLTYMNINNKRWSWCADSRWKRIQFKKSIADAAVDGVIPEGHLRSPAQAHKDTMAWFERLDRGEVYDIERRTISIPLNDEITSSVRRKLGDLSQMNKQMNNALRTHTKIPDIAKSR